MFRLMWLWACPRHKIALFSWYDSALERGPYRVQGRACGYPLLRVVLARTVTMIVLHTEDIKACLSNSMSVHPPLSVKLSWKLLPTALFAEDEPP